MKKIITILLLVSIIFLDSKSVYAITNQEKQLFYKTVEAEVTGAGYESKLRVANVILNRVNSPKFPNTVGKVIKQKGQFSCIADGRMSKAVPTDSAKQAVDDALEGRWVISSKVLFFNVIGCDSYASRNKVLWGKDKVHEFYYE